MIECSVCKEIKAPNDSGGICDDCTGRIMSEHFDSVEWERPCPKCKAIMPRTRDDADFCDNPIYYVCDDCGHSEFEDGQLINP